MSFAAHSTACPNRELALRRLSPEINQCELKGFQSLVAALAVGLLRRRHLSDDLYTEKPFSRVADQFPFEPSWPIGTDQGLRFKRPCSARS
jgi:hypothetical protein